MQVPAGTVQPDETAAEAALREAAEESGLTTLRVRRWLGRTDHDLRPARNEIARRDFFLLGLPAPAPRAWSHRPRPEQHEHESMRFDLRWLPLARGHALAARLGALLGAIPDERD